MAAEKEWLSPLSSASFLLPLPVLLQCLRRQARQVESFLSYPSLKGNRHAKYKLEQAPFNQAVFSVVRGAVQPE
jgi:hypothetical protein